MQYKYLNKIMHIKTTHKNKHWNQNKTNYKDKCKFLLCDICTFFPCSMDSLQVLGFQGCAVSGFQLINDSKYPHWCECEQLSASLCSPCDILIPSPGCISSYASRDRIQPPNDPELDKRMKMDGEFNKPWLFSVLVYPTFNHWRDIFCVAVLL